MMMVVVVIAIVVAIALIGVGLWALFDPHRMSHAYGLPAEGTHAHGFTQATGIRDLVIGGILLAAGAWHNLPFIAVLGVAGILLSIGDFWIAYNGNGRRLHRAHAGHAAGIIAFILVATMALWAINL
ncbi:MAG TPA: DUF4267 domain-containing protein [Candidatus Tumulicola sp.]|jgi:hypothetical protein